MWADAIFVHDPLRLAAWTTTDLVVGAILLHDLCASFDLKLRLPSEYDVRTASNLAASRGGHAVENEIFARESPFLDFRFTREYTLLNPPLSE